MQKRFFFSEGHRSFVRHLAFLLIPFLCVLFGLVSSASAATVTWTGAVDDLASNSANWSGGLVPEWGDDVVFDGTSTNNCTWDIDVTRPNKTHRKGISRKAK